MYLIRIFGLFFLILEMAISFYSGLAIARSQEPMFLGARKRALGGCYVAVADDHEAVFFNPAGLADVTSASIRYLALDLEASTDIYDAVKASSSSLEKLSASTINSLMGKSVYARGQLSPTLLLPNIGVSFLFDHQYGLSVQNQAYPQINVGIQRTRGLQLAFGIPLTHRTRSHRKGFNFSLGIGIKTMFRQGQFRDLDQTELLGVLSGQSFDLENFAGSYNMGIGFDTGFLAKYPLNRVLTWTLGMAYTDIGDTKYGSGAAPQIGEVNLGTALKFDSGFVRALFSYEYSNIFNSIDILAKQHFGAEVGFPFVSALGGFNQLYYTYGAAVDLWAIRVMAVSYGTELATYVRQGPSRRYLLRMDLKFEL